MFLTLEQQESVFSHYMGYKIQFKKRYFSPERNDKNPDCLFKIREDKLYLIDYVAYKSYDCINYASVIEKIDNKETYKKVLSELSKYDLSKLKDYDFIYKNKTSNQPCIITPIYDQWNTSSYSYFKQYHIDKSVLERNCVYPISKWTINGYWYKSSSAFAYFEGNFENRDMYKILNLAILDKKDKWRNNVNGKLIGGLDTLTNNKEFVIITKSKKDKMVLDMLGYDSVYVQSESILFCKRQMDYIGNKRKGIYTLFDNDDRGISLTNLYKETHNTIPLLLQEDKDISDTSKAKGLTYCDKIMKQLCN